MTTDTAGGFDYTADPAGDQYATADPAVEETVAEEPKPKNRAKSSRSASKPKAAPSRAKAPTPAQVRGVLDVVTRVAVADEQVLATARDLIGAEDDTALTVAVATGRAKVPGSVEMVKRLRSADERAVAQIEVGATSATDLRELWGLVCALDGTGDRLPNSAHIKIAIRTVEKVDALSDEQIARLDEVVELVNG